MSQFFKRHIGLIIIIIIAIVFPVSLSNQAKLNMRIIVTGIAIDKTEDGYEATAQIVKTISNTESSGVGAEIDYLSNTASTISFALANLMYKSGKVSAFSHTNFIIIGNDVLDEDITTCLDIFMRDRIVKNSALILFSKEKAKDEIKKTKNMELSVGLGLQKVFSFKEEDCDGIMMTILDFVNDNKSYGKTAVGGVLELSNNSSDNESSSNSGSSGSSESGGLDMSSSKGSSSSNSENSSDKNNKTYFKSNTPLYFFVDGKIALKLTDSDKLLSYMLLYPKTKKCYIEVDNIENENLKDATISVKIKTKKIKKKIRFENDIPCLDLKLTVTNCEVNEIISNKDILPLSIEEAESIKEALKEKISKNISELFLEAKNCNADIFNAYECAYKFNYGTLSKFYDNEQDFLQNLKLNIEIYIKNLDN